MTECSRNADFKRLTSTSKLPFSGTIPFERCRSLLVTLHTRLSTTDDMKPASLLWTKYACKARQSHPTLVGQFHLPWHEIERPVAETPGHSRHFSRVYSAAWTASIFSTLTAANLNSGILP